jgi:L-threonylcarbamoyladenylate synthase
MTTKPHYLDNRAVQKKAVTILKRGGVVIVPTDTLYGLSTAITSETGYRRILDIKQCEGERNFLLLASSVDMVERYVCSWGCATKDLLESIWPAAMTAIFPSGENCPSWVGSTIAFRVPDYQPILSMIEQLDVPILSTSVNVKDNAPLHLIEVIREQFGSSVDFIAESKTAKQDLPSTIIDFHRSEPHVIRQGSYSW